MASPGIVHLPTAASTALVAAAALLAGCAGSGAFPQPTAKHVEYSERGGYPATLPSLKNGRRLYVNRCSGCHSLYHPAEYPPGDWPRIVLDMQSNAELNEVQMVDITRYLVAISTAAREVASPAGVDSVGNAPPAAP
jgi:hypothetical protein